MSKLINLIRCLLLGHLFLIQSAESLKVTCEDEGSTKNFCSTGKCKSFSARMISSIDWSVEPCEDFYSFACGRVEDSKHLLPDDLENDVNRRITDELETLDDEKSVMTPAGIFYDACELYFQNRSTPQAKTYASTVIERIGKLNLKIPAINGTLVANGEPFSTSANLTFIFSEFLKMNFAPFFDIVMEIDSSSDGLFIPKITLPQDHFHLSKSEDVEICLRKFQKTLKEYRNRNETLDLNENYNDYVKKCMSQNEGLGARLDRMTSIIRKLSITDSLHDNAAIEKLITSTRVETELLLIQTTPILLMKEKSTRSAMMRTFEEYTVQQLDDMKVFGDLISWKELLERLTDQVMKPDQRVRVYNKDELIEIIGILSSGWKENPETTQNSLLMMWSEYIYSSLVEPRGRSHTYCLDLTKTLLPDISSALYLHSFPDAALVRLQKSVRTEAVSIKNEIIRIMENHGGVEPKLLEKMRNAEFDIGASHDAASKNTTLMENMKGFKLNQNHYHNVDVLLSRYRRLYYGLINNERNSTKALWIQGIVPYRTSGATVVELNKIYIPYGVMTAPFYYNKKSLPGYINFAGLGNIIASQFLHLIDRTGLLFDSMGNLASPPTDPPNSYVFSSECLNDQLMIQQHESKGVKAKASFPVPLQLNDILASTGAARISWFTHISNMQDGREVKDWTYSPETQLVWMGKRALTPLQAYWLRIAQSQCQSKSDLDLVSIMEGTRLPAHLRMNLVARNEPLFSKAFNCKSPDPMFSWRGACPYSLDFTSITV